MFHPMTLPDMSEEELADGLEKLHLTTEMFASSEHKAAAAVDGEQLETAVSKLDDPDGIYVSVRVYVHVCVCIPYSPNYHGILTL